MTRIGSGIEELAERHNLEPTHREPWKKILVGGSDDHGGKFIASAFTDTPAVDSATHGGGGPTKPAAGLFMRRAFQAAQHHRPPVLFRQPFQLVVQYGLQLTHIHVQPRIGRFHAFALPFLHAMFQRRCSCLHGHVPRHAMQPGCDRSSLLNRMSLFRQHQERCLKSPDCRSAGAVGAFAGHKGQHDARQRADVFGRVRYPVERADGEI